MDTHDLIDLADKHLLDLCEALEISTVFRNKIHKLSNEKPPVHYITYELDDETSVYFSFIENEKVELNSLKGKITVCVKRADVFAQKQFILLPHMGVKYPFEPVGYVGKISAFDFKMLDDSVRLEYIRRFMAR